MEYVKVWSIVKVQRMVCRGKNTTCISILHLKSSLETNYDKNKKVSLINLWRNISDAALCLRLVFLQWPWSGSTGLCLALWCPFLGLLLDTYHIWGSPYSHIYTSDGLRKFILFQIGFSVLFLHNRRGTSEFPVYAFQEGQYRFRRANTDSGGPIQIQEG